MPAPTRLADGLFVLGLALFVAVMVGITTWAVPETGVAVLAVLAVICLGIGTTLAPEDAESRKPRTR